MTFYFDLDGVLAEFIEEDSRLQKWRDTGYFQRLPVDRTALQIARYLSLIQGGTIKILTRIFNEPENNPIWTADKKFWCEKNVDFIDTSTNFICTAMLDKSHILNPIPKELRKYHVLIDDEPHNLQTWADKSGTAVQYLQPNRLVDKWPGFKLYAKHGGTRCLARLTTHLKNIENGEPTW